MSDLEDTYPWFEYGDDIDEILDGDFPLPHLDPIEDYDPADDPGVSFDNAKYYIGNNKAVIQKTVIPRDPWAYERRKVADRFGIPEDELPEEPDHMAIDEQGWA